ncbi:hypothetical protein BDW68DRAFT_167705 [Aspergillus falconensis]
MRPLTATGPANPPQAWLRRRGRKRNHAKNRRKAAKENQEINCCSRRDSRYGRPGTTWHGLTARLRLASCNSRLLLHLPLLSTLLPVFLLLYSIYHSVNKLFTQHGPNLNSPPSQSQSAEWAPLGTRWLDTTVTLQNDRPRFPVFPLSTDHFFLPLCNRAALSACPPTQSKTLRRLIKRDSTDPPSSLCLNSKRIVGFGPCPQLRIKSHRQQTSQKCR